MKMVPGHSVHPNRGASFGRRAVGMEAAGTATERALVPGPLPDGGLLLRLSVPPPEFVDLPKSSPNSCCQILIDLSLDCSAKACFAMRA